MLNLSGIKKTYNRGDVTRMCLFDGFDLSVKDGEFVSIVGSNGSGKTVAAEHHLRRHSRRRRRNPDPTAKSSTELPSFQPLSKDRPCISEPRDGGLRRS